MPQVYYVDNYCFELTNLYVSVYKYDILDNSYYKIDQCSLQKIPNKYKHILEDIKQCPADNLVTSLQQIQISS